MESPYSEDKQHQLESSRSYINSFSYDVDETLGNPNHYTIVMGYFNAQIGKRTNYMEIATGKFWLELKSERGDTLVEWATTSKYRIMTSMFQKKAGTRWTWIRQNGIPTTEINYILTNRPDIVTDVTVINQVNIENIENDHRLVRSNIKLDLEVERKKCVDATRIGPKKIEFQHELRNQFETLQKN